jgi:hypothetical protein
MGSGIEKGVAYAYMFCKNCLEGEALQLGPLTYCLLVT